MSTDDRPCGCWVQVALHEGHCCMRNMPEDVPDERELPCGHQAEGMAILAEAHLSPCNWTSPDPAVREQTEKLTPTCEYNTTPAPYLILAPGDQVTVCTAQAAWTVQSVTPGGIATLTSTDRWKHGTPYRVHVAHLEAVPGAEPDLLGLLDEATP